ncbi:sulfite exporter TauE/SafE family protein, partial [Candidatus Aerophobetes bacterium]|nr:sulfite exporter TauE/SafE family protein [Candidatus Aerophobetes bacterium]
GAKLSVKAKPAFVKYLVIGVMVFAAILNILKGLKGLGII